MQDDRLPEILAKNRPEGVRSRGRPKKRWKKSYDPDDWIYIGETGVRIYIEEEEKEAQKNWRFLLFCHWSYSELDQIMSLTPGIKL